MLAGKVRLVSSAVAAANVDVTAARAPSPVGPPEGYVEIEVAAAPTAASSCS